MYLYTASYLPQKQNAFPTSSYISYIHFTIWKVPLITISLLYHASLQDYQSAEIRDGTFTRLEHSITGRWLGGSKDEPYHRKMPTLNDKDKLVQVLEIKLCVLF